MPQDTSPDQTMDNVLDNGADASGLAMPGEATGWHLDAINIAGAWQDYTGQGVRVGIVDDGVNYTHQELDGNYNTAIDHDYRDNDDDSYGGGHGTQVASVVAAEADGQGNVGIAYNAEIAGFRIGYGSAGNPWQYADAIEGAAASMDVINNSWAYSYVFTDDFLSEALFGPGATALETAAASGRDGLGTINVFAAGNSRWSGDSANAHNFQNSPYTIAVGSVDPDGTYSGFSNPGANLLVSAPGKSIDTAIGGSDGYGSASGTSFSAPIVSGVAALLLEANPLLGYRDVQEILAYSAQHNDAGAASWAYNNAGTWNGGGLHFSNDYGFGLVDATAAVRLAETWTKQQVFANKIDLSASSAPGEAIPDQGSVSDSITINENVDIDVVQVRADISHTAIGDLVIKLVSPSGTESTLIERPGGAGNTYNNMNFTFTANNFWGEESAGTWTLKVYDMKGTEIGTLNNWDLMITGDAISADDLYVYNDQYGDFTGADLAARSVLSDADGGTDTINAAMVTTDTMLDLTPGATGSLAGNGFTIAAGTVIENALLGDGNDQVTGNGADNYLFGGRGDDLLAGAAGDDRLEGGRGNDVLQGGAGSDTAVFGWNFSDYQIYDAGDHLTIEGLGDAIADGLDQLFDIEFLQFADGLFSAADLGSTPPPPPPPPGNTGPVAGDDAASVEAGQSVVIDVLANDTDADGDALTVTGISVSPSHGTVTVNQDGTLSYVAADGFAGDDVFTYQISDGNGGVSEATVTVSVTAPPPPSTGGETITGTDGKDVLNGTAGDDVIDGGRGADEMYGGGGDDTYIVDRYGDKVYEDAGNGTDTVISSFDHWLASNVENLTLTGDAVKGIGNNDDNVIIGSDGDNILKGRGGDDVLIGGAGNDQLYGNAGADRFVYTDLLEGVDDIMDFKVGEDILDLRGLVSAQGLGNDALATGQIDLVQTGAGAALWVDTDGAGGSAAVEIAVLHNVDAQLLEDSGDIWL